MNVFRHIQDLFDRLPSYAWWEVAIELSVIWIAVYFIVKFAQGTRAAGALKGVLLIFVVFATLVWLLGGGQTFTRIGLLFDRLLQIVAIGLVVLFQPELRRALIRLGERPIFKRSPSEIAEVVEPIVEAAQYLARARFGALIVLERQAGLDSLLEGGTRMNARLSAPLLQTIFFPGSALHDLAVVVRGKVIHAANVQLPLADPEDMPDRQLGSRHRAAVGLTKECDAIVVVISEETGLIRLAERGRLTPGFQAAELKKELSSRLAKVPPAAGESAADADAEAEAMAEARLNDNADDDHASPAKASDKASNRASRASPGGLAGSGGGGGGRDG